MSFVTPPNTPPTNQFLWNNQSPVGAATIPGTSFQPANAQSAIAQPSQARPVSFVYPVNLAFGGQNITIPAGSTVPSFGVINPIIPTLPNAGYYDLTPIAIPDMTQHVRNELLEMFPGTIIPDFEDWPWSVSPTEAAVEDIWEKYNAVTVDLGTHREAAAYLMEVRARASALVASANARRPVADVPATIAGPGGVPRANIVVPVANMGLTMDLGEESDEWEDMEDEDFEQEILEQDVLTMEERMEQMDVGYDAGDEKMDVEN